jgi:hypothetical protein
MRIVATGLAFLLALPAAGALAFFAVVFLAGPHGGVLPDWTQLWILALGWLVTLAVPLLVARQVWLCAGRATHG